MEKIRTMEEKSEFAAVARAIMKADPSIVACVRLIKFLAHYTIKKMELQQSREGLHYGSVTGLENENSG